MTTYDPSQSANYYILGDSNAEMVHLIEVDWHFNKAIGGLLPEQPEQTLFQIHDVLDVACGPGGWVLELAQAHPHMKVTGFDLSQGMIDYATVQARASGLDNAIFKTGNIMELFDVPDESFDLVNARHIEGVIPLKAWSPMLKEMYRVARPGGIIRITDCEWGVSNSAAFEELLALSVRAMQIGGMSHSPDGRNYSISQMLRRFLQDIGCENIQERPTIMDFSAGSPMQQENYRDFTLGFQLIEPFLLAMKIITREKLGSLQRQLSVEMLEEDFRGIIYILTAWGQKPGKSSQ